MLDTKELAEDATFHERGILQTMEHPDGREFHMPAWPVRHNGAHGRGQAGARCWASTPARCSQAWLGLSAREIAGLAQDKVIQQRPNDEHQATRKAYGRRRRPWRN